MLSNIVNYIFIIHYKKLKDRKNYIDSYFKTHNITNFEYRSDYQREDLTPEISNKYFKLNNLNSAQICITIEHIETYRKIANNSFNDETWYLILEDDAKPIDDFIEKLNIHLNNIPQDADYLDINSYFNYKSNNLWEKKELTRTTGSYLIKKKTCKLLLNTIIPFKLAIDHELNYQFKLHKFNIYWSGTPLVSNNNISSYIQWRP